MSFYEPQNFSLGVLHQELEARFKVVILEWRDSGVDSSIHDGFDAQFLQGIADVPRFDCKSQSCYFHFVFQVLTPNHAHPRCRGCR